MSGVRFLKMSGAGNDFVVVGPDGLARIAEPLADWTRRVARRHHGVGADGALFVEPAEEGAVRVRFLNPDGSEAFCGNGSRCAARFAALAGLAGARMTLLTAAGAVPAEVRADGTVELVLPPPVDRGEVEAGASAAPPPPRWRRVDAGTPHAVAVVEDAAAAPLAVWGPAVRRDPAFAPAGTNVNVLSAGADGVWSLRTFEKGVEGETLACGSGAVAAALVARRHGAGRSSCCGPRAGSR